MPQIQTIVPKYLQIANKIRDEILRGDHPPDAEIPSERQLAADWNVSRPTAARALQALRAQGLVESRQGSGTYVLDPKAPRRAAHRYHRVRERGAQYGPDESVVITDAGIVAAPGYVVAAFDLAPGSNAMMRRRIISRVGRGPVEIATSWWPEPVAEVAPRLLVLETLGGIGSVGYVESVTGRQAAYARDQMAARLASPAEIQDLTLDQPPQAVLAVRHTVYDTNDRPLEFAEAVYPPNEWTVEQEYPVHA